MIEGSSKDEGRVEPAKVDKAENYGGNMTSVTFRRFRTVLLLYMTNLAQRNHLLAWQMSGCGAK